MVSRLFRSFNEISPTVVGAAAIVAFFSAASRMVGFVRDRLLANLFGASPELDAYYAAFKLPDLLFSVLVVGGLSASFLPLFLERWQTHHPEQGFAFTNRILNALFLLMAIGAVAGIVFAPVIAQLIAPGFDPVRLAWTAENIRVLLLAQVLLCLSTVFGSVLQGVKRFALSAAAPIVYNVGIMIGAIAFVPFLGPVGLSWGVVLGALFHLLIQWRGVHLIGYRWQSLWSLSHPDVLELFRLSGPRFLGVGVSHLSFAVFTILASWLPTGSITIFQLVYNIQFFPVGIFGFSYAIATFPAFSEALQRRDQATFQSVIQASARQLLFLLAPCTMLFLLLRGQAIRLVVGNNALTDPQVVIAADALALFALSFLPQAAAFLLARVSFALKNTMIPLVAGAVSSMTGLFVALTFLDEWGVVALAAAFAVSAGVNALLLWFALRGLVGSFGEAAFVRPLFIVVSALIPSALVLQLTKPVTTWVVGAESTLGLVLQGGVSGGLALGTYAGVTYLLGSEESRTLFALARKKLWRRSEASEPVAPDTTFSV